MFLYMAIIFHVLKFYFIYLYFTLIQCHSFLYFAAVVKYVINTKNFNFFQDTVCVFEAM